jgi:endonuclease/exonuclease/phosphatase family metal-dependent hydrolase
MPPATLTRLGAGLRAVIRIRLDGATAALGASALGALTAPLTQLLPDQSGSLAWLVDLAAHWQWLYLIVGVISGVMLLRRGARVPVALAAALIGLGWFSASAPAEGTSADSRPRFTVVSANLNLGQADLVVLEEVTIATAQAIAQWKDYPHQLVTPEEGPFGLAVLSRHPMTDTVALESLEQPLRYRAFVSWQQRRVGISAIHPMPPIDSLYHVRRAQMLEEEARWARSAASPSIVAGDLNASPWSSTLRAIAPAGLRRATGLQPTWPGMLPVIPIDHILTNEVWQVVTSGVGPDIGSDHRPVFALLSLDISTTQIDGASAGRTERWSQHFDSRVQARSSDNYRPQMDTRPQTARVDTNSVGSSPTAR